MLLSSCAPAVEVRDQDLYWSMGSLGAAHTHTLLPTTSQIDTISFQNNLWLNLKDPLVCTPASQFAEEKKVREKLCDGGRCTYVRPSN